MGILSIAKEINLRQYSYHGLILPDRDPKNQGRYKVHIPELHPLIEADLGIYVKNQQHNWRYGPSDDHMYGEYYPLHAGTKVLIKFYENDFHTGYVDRIISDQIISTTPKIAVDKIPEATTDRDDIYMIFKTPKKHNLFAVLEETSDGENKLDSELIPNSIHLYYNYRRSTMILNEDGIHWFSMDNRGVTIEGNNSEWVHKTEKIYIHEDRHLFINGKHRHHVHKDYDSTIDGEHREHSCDQHSTTSSDKITEDAPTIWMNSGLSKPARMAESNKGEDEIVKQNKIDMRVVAHQYRDDIEDTYYGDEGIPIVGGTPPDNGTGDPEKNKLQVGMNDRYSSIGAEQVGVDHREYPPYPEDTGGCGSTISDSKSVTNELGLTSSNMIGAAGGMDSAMQDIADAGSIPGVDSVADIAETGGIPGMEGDDVLSSIITVDPSEFESTLPTNNPDLDYSNFLEQFGGESPLQHQTLAEKLGLLDMNNDLNEGGILSAHKDAQQSIVSNLGDVFNITGENPLSSALPSVFADGGDVLSGFQLDNIIGSDIPSEISLEKLVGADVSDLKSATGSDKFFVSYLEALDLNSGKSLTEQISNTIFNDFSGSLSGIVSDKVQSVGIAAGLGDLQKNKDFSKGLDPFSYDGIMGSPSLTGTAGPVLDTATNVELSLFGNNIDFELDACSKSDINTSFHDYGLKDFVNKLSNGLTGVLSGLNNVDSLLCDILGPVGLGTASDKISPVISNDINKLTGAGITNINSVNNIITGGMYDALNNNFATSLNDSFGNINYDLGQFGGLLCGSGGGGGGGGFPGSKGLSGCASKYPDSTIFG